MMLSNQKLKGVRIPKEAVIRFFGLCIASFILGSGATSYAKTRCHDSIASQPLLHRALGIFTQLEQPHRTFNSSSTPQAMPSNNNSMLIWNVQKQSRKNWIRDFIHLAQNADISILQEATNHIFKLPLMSRSDWSFGASWEKEDQFQTGVITISKTQVRDSEFVLAGELERVMLTPKSSMVTIHPIQRSDLDLMVINIHGLILTPTSSLRRQVLPLVNRVREHRGPVIFAGDMNTWKGARLDMIKSLLGSVGLTHIPAKGHRGIFTLDHVFARGLINVEVSSQTHFKSSDHSPLILTFDIDL